MAHNRIYRTRRASVGMNAGRSSKEIAVIRVDRLVPVIFAHSTCSRTVELTRRKDGALDYDVGATENMNAAVTNARGAGESNVYGWNLNERGIVNLRTRVSSGNKF